MCDERGIQLKSCGEKEEEKERKERKKSTFWPPQFPVSSSFQT